MKKWILIFTGLMVVFPAMAQGDNTSPQPAERKTSVIFSVGAGVGPADMDYGISKIFGDGAAESSVSSWNRYDPAFSTRASLRFCSVGQAEAEKLEPWQGGWGLELELSKVFQKGAAFGLLFHDFHSTNFCFTPGLQLISPAGRAGLFIGLLGMGSSRTDFQQGHNYYRLQELVEAGLQWSADEVEEGEASVTFTTEIWPVTAKIFPVELNLWLSEKLGVNLRFSGLQLWAGESQLMVYWPENNQKPENEWAYWLGSFKEGKPFDAGFCLIKSFQLEVGVSVKLK